MVEKLVSIIMPAYNCADYILESIKSVQNQSYRNWELIVADDNLSDEEIMQQLRPQLEVYKLPVEIERINAIPKTGSGKIQRLSLKKK